MSNATLLKGYRKHYGSEKERERERESNSTALVMPHPFVKKKIGCFTCTEVVTRPGVNYNYNCN